MLSGLRKSASFRSTKSLVPNRLASSHTKTGTSHLDVDQHDYKVHKVHRYFKSERREEVNTQCSKSILASHSKTGTSHLDIEQYDYTVSKLRDFFKNKGWKEVNTQYRKSILAACEDPETVSTFEYEGQVWPLPQTGQMWLEHDLLKNPDVEGVFTVSTSYRSEPDPIPGRHQTIFPMFEFEGRGDLVNLRNTERDLLRHLGFGKKDPFVTMNYDKASKTYNADIIEDLEEGKLCTDYGPVVFLERFPEHTSPFWNMYWERYGIEHEADGKKVWEQVTHARKIDVIIHGQETIGSAEREISPEVMRERFETTSDGAYAQKLRDLFGEERVNQELENFLTLDFCQRFGGGIGIHRLMRGMQLENIMEPVREPLYKDYSWV